MLRKVLTSLMLISGLTCCNGQQKNFTNEAPSHQIWNELVQKYVNEEGLINYRGILTEIEKLDAYLALLSKGAPNRASNSQDVQIAYWINAYNAFTVKLILDNYPLKSIKDLNPAVSIPTLNTIWSKKFFRIGDKEMSLDNIEHDILRKEFNEPRIHFAINCASVSCPPLRNEAYSGEKLQSQLAEQAEIFINDPMRNKITMDQIELSKIFDWFKSDFTKNGSLIDFLNRYSHTEISSSADVDFMLYDWNLNEGQ